MRCWTIRPRDADSRMAASVRRGRDRRTGSAALSGVPQRQAARAVAGEKMKRTCVVVMIVLTAFPAHAGLSLTERAHPVFKDGRKIPDRYIGWPVTSTPIFPPGIRFPAPQQVVVVAPQQVDDLSHYSRLTFFVPFPPLLMLR